MERKARETERKDERLCRRAQRSDADARETERYDCTEREQQMADQRNAVPREHTRDAQQ